MPAKKMNLPLIARRAEVRADSIDLETREIDVVWTTGATVQRVRWEGWDDRVEYDEQLDVSAEAVRLDFLNSGGPFLDAHRAWGGTTTIGSVVPGSVKIEDGRGYARIKLTAAPDAAGIVQRILEQTIRFVSVGYRVYRYEITKREGQREHWRAADWEPLEISAVAIPADRGAVIRSDERLSECVVVVRGDDPSPSAEASAVEPAATPAAQQQMRSEMPAKNTPVAGDQGDTEVRREAPAPASDPAPVAPQPNAEQVRREERERISAINALADQFGLERAFADDLVTRGVSVADARSAVLDKLAERDERGNGHTQVSMPAGGLDENTTRREAMVEAILHRAQPADFQLSDRAREYRGMRLLDIARECLDAAGVRTRGMSPNEIAMAATKGAVPGGFSSLNLRAAGPMSTSDFPMILANVAGKRLRGAYASTPRTFQRWARGITATDFKPMYPTQIGNFPALKAVQEGAEFSYGSIAEGRESYQLATYGRIVALTRQAIINDDLRAFDRALGTAGQKAADLEAGIVYNILIANAALADGTALFHANHGNLLTASVINEGALAAMMEAFAQQKDLDDEEYIANRPRFILVPPGQRSVEARKQVAATTPNSTQDVNAFAGSFEVIEEPRLFLAGGPQPWFMAADPNLVDTVEYAHLEGQMEPFIDQRVGFEVDGVEIKVRHDFAAKALDYRGLAKNVGANPA